MLYFIDTNIFLRVLIKEDETQYARCYSVLKAIKENKIKARTSTVVLTEIVWTLNSYYKFPKKDITIAVRSILHLRGLDIKDYYNYPKALEWYEKYSIKFIDALIASHPEIQEKKMTIISYDRDYRKLPVLFLTPEKLKIIQDYSS